MLVRGETRVVRVLLVFGTRPEAIKMLPVVRELRRRSRIETIVAVTGQHRHMLDQVFALFDERPDLDLDLMTPNQTLGEITARVLNGMAAVYDRTAPDLVLVHGDTTSAMAAAMAAFYARIPVGHVEAGLRSFDLARPWPEEFNRVTIDSMAHLLFAPTDVSAANLRREYNRAARVVVTGNTGIDALMHTSRRLDIEPELTARLRERYQGLDPAKRLILVTGHRRESFGDGFAGICEALKRIAARGDVDVLYPVHLNPNVRQVVGDQLDGVPGIHLTAPVDYAEMVYLMKRAHLILTDSGGIQEEGPALGRPVLVMRDVTERPEAVASGVVQLVGTDAAVITAKVAELLDNKQAYRERARVALPYGDGTAARAIADAVTGWAFEIQNWRAA